MIKIIDPILVSFYSIEIRWYGFLIVLALVISLFILNYLLKKEENLDFDFFLDFFILALPVGILAARLYYVLFNLNYYLKEPAKILAINEGGLAIHGGLLAGIVVLYVFSLKKENNFLLTLDYLAPLTAFSQAIGRWGNFINQEAYGKIVKQNYYSFLPEFIKKQMYINGSYREATFLYESIADFLLFVFLLFYLRSKNKKRGEVFAFYLIFYSLARFFIEEQRVDSLLIYEFQLAKLISLVLILIGLSLLFYIHKFNQS
ncbi:MAG: prolipoprotein diacylglyceryl transferase [Bacillota bacterium]